MLGICYGMQAMTSPDGAERQEAMTKKRETFIQWLVKQTDRTDSVGSLAKDYHENRHFMWLYRLLGFRSTEELRMQIVRAFVEYKTGIVSKAQTARRDRPSGHHRDERRPLA